MKNGNQKHKFWIFFVILLISNSFLSYSSFSYLVKGWVFFLGIVAPVIFFLGSPILRLNENEKIYGKETISFSNTRAIWVIFGLLSILIRFFRLTQIYLWPTGDEALHGFLALSLLKNWNWHFFYTVGEHPPLLIWMLALFLKVFKSPFMALWLLPALFSVINIPLGYFCAREFLPKSTSILFTFFLAFSFWPLYSSRFCHQGLFIAFWEFSTFLLMFRWITHPLKPKPILWPLLLGIWCGLGTLTFISWIFVLLFLLTTILILAHKKLISNVILFLVFLSFGLLPLALAFLNEGYGHHLADSSTFSHWFSNSHQVITHFSYITSLFWGSLQSDTSYGPTWGGILNPVLTSCFFIGIVSLFQERFKTPTKWIVLGFVFCMLPAFMVGDYVELNRIIQVMPFLLLIVVLGLQKVLLEIGDEKKRKMMLYVLLFSSFLDAKQFLNPTFEYFRFRKTEYQSSSDPDLKAYQILNSLHLNKGPEIIFTEFLPVKYGTPFL